MILGLDISTSITGYAIIDYDGTIVKIGSWDLRNKNHYPDFYSKVIHCKERLKDIGITDVEIVEHEGIGEIVAPHYEIVVGDETFQPTIASKDPKSITNQA